MNDIKSISKTVKILDKYRVQYALLHCTNVYPTPPNIVRLSCINDLQLKFKKAVVGYSDHTINNNACKSAIALGASIVERHYTDVKSRKGPDIINSMNHNELRDLILSSESAEVSITNCPSSILKTFGAPCTHLPALIQTFSSHVTFMTFSYKKHISPIYYLNLGEY